MPFKILSPIEHGKESKIFHLKPSDVVADDFFTGKEIVALSSLAAIEPTNNTTLHLPTHATSIEIQTKDILSLSVVEAKELIDNEINLTTLEKYVDQCRAHDQSPSAKKILKAAERRIHELTGHVYATRF